VGVVFVVVFNLGREQCQGVPGIRQRRDVNIVALEGVHEGFRYAVALWAFDRCKAGFQPDLPGEDACFAGGIGGAIIGQHLDRRRGSAGAEAAFNGLEHHVADVRATDACAGHSAPADDLPVMCIDDESAAHDLAIPAVELEAIRAPAQVDRMVTTFPSWP
jgi:hypothetical protein